MEIVSFAGPGRRRLGQLVSVPPAFVLSPVSGLLIPRFQVDLVNGTKRKRVDLGFDTGMEGAHLEVPASLARELGIVRTDSELFADASGISTASVGKVDWIGLTENPSCGVKSGKVIFRENAPLLIGNDFIRDIGASIRYGSQGPSIVCSSTGTEAGQYLPMFRVAIMNRGKIVNVEALFDTGWDGADLALPQSEAADLGLVAIGTQTARTHTGTVTFVQAKAERVSLRDLGQCYVNDAIVDIHPRGSPMDERGMAIIGEPFFKKTGGILGYDSEGAFYTCRAASGQQVRATRRSWFPIESILRELESDPALPWVAGGGLMALGLLAWLAFKK
jgi:hypothetical protein